MNLVRVQKVKLSLEGWTEFRRVFLWLSRANPEIHEHILSRTFKDHVTYIKAQKSTLT